MDSGIFTEIPIALLAHLSRLGANSHPRRDPGTLRHGPAARSRRRALRGAPAGPPRMPSPAGPDRRLSRRSPLRIGATAMKPMDRTHHTFGGPIRGKSAAFVPAHRIVLAAPVLGSAGRLLPHVPEERLQRSKAHLPARRPNQVEPGRTRARSVALLRLRDLRGRPDRETAGPGRQARADAEHPHQFHGRPQRHAGRARSDPQKRRHPADAGHARAADFLHPLGRGEQDQRLRPAHRLDADHVRTGRREHSRPRNRPEPEAAHRYRRQFKERMDYRRLPQPRLHSHSGMAVHGALQPRRCVRVPLRCPEGPVGTFRFSSSGCVPSRTASRAPVSTAAGDRRGPGGG